MTQVSSTDVETIFELLTGILFRALDEDQRRSVLKGLPIGGDIALVNNETAVYRGLVERYRIGRELGFVIDIVGRIESIRVFYQVAHSDLAQLKLLLEASGVAQEVERSKKPYVFVILPFDDENLLVYHEAVKPVLANLGCDVEYGDEAFTVTSIIEIVLESIRKASFVVADMSGRNANVFYEVGFAHGIGKQSILLTQDTKDLPFNVRGYRHIKYSPSNLGGLRIRFRETASKLLSELEARGNEERVLQR